MTKLAAFVIQPAGGVFLKKKTARSKTAPS
jgi:hypothetical protein